MTDVSEREARPAGGKGSILVATRSPGKLRELRPLLAGQGFAGIDLADAGIAESAEEQDLECFETFEENALAKARYFAQRTGFPTIADDSGLEVAALDGRPGVRSKRWSGRADLSGVALDAANNERLIVLIRGQENRRARYVCAAAFVDAGREVVRRGHTDGEIVLEPSGANGFGYDPYFHSSESRCTFGEAPLEDKERVSHRGRAFRALLGALEDQAR